MFLIILGILLLEAIMLIVLVKNEKAGLAALSVIVLVAIFSLTGLVNTVQFLRDNMLAVVLGLVLYIPAGVVASFVFWDTYVAELAEDLKQFKASGEASKKIWNRGPIPPLAREHKRKLAYWITLWPVYFVSDFLYKYLHLTATRIVNALLRSYQRIADRHFQSSL